MSDLISKIQAAQREAGERAVIAHLEQIGLAQPAPITSDTGNQAAQGASAITSVPLHECTRSHPHENMDRLCILRTEIARLTNENARLKSGFSDAAQVLTLDEISDLAMQSGAHDEQLLAFARAIEQAVRSKLGAGVPMTDEQAGRIAIDDGWNASDPEYRAFIDGIRAAERQHGIVGKEGA